MTAIAHTVIRRIGVAIMAYRFDFGDQASSLVGAFMTAAVIALELVHV